MDGFTGVTAIETRAGAMVSLKAPVTEFMVAVTETLPLALAVRSPPCATVAIVLSDELQLTKLVKSLVVWSL